MDAIVKMYGKFILEGIAVICLTLFLFGDRNGSEYKGILENMGSRLPVEEKGYDSYTDFRAIYIEESRKNAPVIEYAAGAQQTGTIILSQVIRAIDYDGNVLPIVIWSIRNMDGEELIESYNPDSAEIVLEQAGIYTIEVSATDDGNRTTGCSIRMPVNRRMIGGE